ncbi:MAG: 5-formyltetrahydrofolate cyclo-ligase [Paracoccaceae bacterium]
MTGEGPNELSSSPCMTDEVEKGLFDPLAVQDDELRAIARWRKLERERLRAERMLLRQEQRSTIAEALIAELDRYLEDALGDPEGRIISGYWPIKGEPDLRPWLASMIERGATVALPVVVVPSSPLVFRRWTPETKMERGNWNIPVPPADSQELVPEIALAPLVGWDSRGYRLGYGGGYFDRTLASLSPRPHVIGVGLQSAHIGTIYPQPHDIRMSAIVTEAGVQVEPR